MGLLLRAWGSRLQMKDRTQDDDNDDAILGICFFGGAWMGIGSIPLGVINCGAGPEYGEVNDTLTFLPIPSWVSNLKAQYNNSAPQKKETDQWSQMFLDHVEVSLGRLSLLHPLVPQTFRKNLMLFTRRCSSWLFNNEKHPCGTNHILCIKHVSKSDRQIALKIISRNLMSFCDTYKTSSIFFFSKLNIKLTLPFFSSTTFILTFPLFVVNQHYNLI